MIINATIQVVPLAKPEDAFPRIDKVISLIQNSGLKYSIGAFETFIEGEYEPVQQLLRQISDHCNAQKETQFLIYTKLHICGSQNILSEDKVSKFHKDTDFSL